MSRLLVSLALLVVVAVPLAVGVVAVCQTLDAGDEAPITTAFEEELHANEQEFQARMDAYYARMGGPCFDEETVRIRLERRTAVEVIFAKHGRPLPPSINARVEAKHMAAAEAKRRAAVRGSAWDR